MSNVQEIENAVRKLSRQELTAFRGWFQEFDAEAWDRKIEEDATSGRLDAFYRRLQPENEGQPDIPLNDFLDKEQLS